MKRLTNTLFVIFLMTNILFGQVQLPTFQYLTVAPKTVKNNENIEITISVFDSIYGIRNLAVSIFNPENENIFQVLVRSTDYVGNNTYKANYRISEWAVSGVYKVGDLVVINNNDNILRNLTTLDSFTVVSSAPDNVPPTISNVKLYVDTLNPGDSLKCEFEIIDVGSGLHHLWFDLYDPITGMANYEVRFF
ncbi:MAG: hypothetical protein IPF54_24170 [Draconibacterium sp.]|nr:hypothetical protein [Draconibacterium sp.]